MNAKKKWAVQEKVKKDMAQTVFFAENNTVDFKGNPNKYAMVTSKGIDPFKFSTCPFCLSWLQIRKTLISTKKGYDRGQGECPVCKKGFKLATLVMMQKCTAQQYAKWVFDYKGFWKKVDFEHWKKHLGMMKWAEPFWVEYKAVAGRR